MASRPNDEEAILACCSASYSHPLARWLLGDSFHPGGVMLTTRLARLADIGPDSTVLDAGSGRGASAVHLAKTLGCRVIGVTLEPEGVDAANDLARQRGVEDRVTFLQGDVQTMDFVPEAFDAVLMECVLSTLPRKSDTLRRLAGFLQPDGRLALTDVTVSGPLPEHLHDILSVAGCVGDARSLDGYRDLAEHAGFVVDHVQDLPETTTTFLREIRGKMLIAEAAIALGKLPIDESLVTEGKRLLTDVEDLAGHGLLSYGLIVGRVPART